jgi:hypothetical protein
VFVVCCVGSDLCDELITRPEESYRVRVCPIVCDLQTPTRDGSGPIWAVVLQKKIETLLTMNIFRTHGVFETTINSYLN